MRSVLTALILLASGCPQPQPSNRPQPPACAEGWLADQRSCVPEACGTGTWGSIPTDDTSIHVDAAAIHGGDGSAESPLRSIQAALDLAGEREGALVVVAAGLYPETLTLDSSHAGTRVEGRCRAMVTIDASVGDSGTPGVTIDGRYGAVELSGLELVGSTYVGILIESGQVRLVDMGVSESAHVGIGIFMGSSPAPSSLEIEGGELTGNVGAGLVAYDSGVRVVLVDTTVTETSPPETGAETYGIQVRDGATLSAQHCELVANTGVGLLGAGAGTRVELTDTTIRDTQPDSSGWDGMGVQVLEEAALSAERCVLADNASVGLFAHGAGTEATLQDCSILDTHPDIAGWGYGVEAYGGVTLTARHCELAGNLSLGIAVSGYGTEVSLEDTVIRDTLPDGTGDRGYGIGVQHGASLSATRCALVGNTGVGLQAHGAGTHVELLDSTITGTRAGTGPRGAAAEGIAAQQGAWVTATELQVLGTEGPGLYAAAEGARIGCTDCSLQDNRFAGAVAFHDGALEIRSSAISGNLESADLGGGVGIFAAHQPPLEPPSLLVIDSVISNNPVAGVWLAGEGAYELHGNSFSGAIGLAHGAGTRCGDGVYARGVWASSGGSGLALTGNEFTRNVGAGLLLDDASAAHDGNAWFANEPDLLIQGEACLLPIEAWADVPSSEICPEWDRPSCDLVFSLSIPLSDIEPATVPLHTHSRSRGYPIARSDG